MIISICCDKNRWSSATEYYEQDFTIRVLRTSNMMKEVHTMNEIIKNIEAAQLKASCTGVPCW